MANSTLEYLATSNWFHQRLRVFGSKVDLQKFYKKTSTKQSHFDLCHIHKLVDGFECNSRDVVRSDLIEIQDIAQKDILFWNGSNLQGKQYSKIETIWGWRPELYLKLSQLFPNLILEVYFIEENLLCWGAVLYKKGQLYGDSIASGGTLFVDEEEDLIDWDYMEIMHLNNIYAGRKLTMTFEPKN